MTTNLKIEIVKLKHNYVTYVNIIYHQPTILTFVIHRMQIVIFFV